MEEFKFRHKEETWLVLSIKAYSYEEAIINIEKCCIKIDYFDYLPSELIIKKTKKSYFKSVIRRLLSVISFVIFLITVMLATCSQYWLIHWILFGRSFYDHLWSFIDKHNLQFN